MLVAKSLRYGGIYVDAKKCDRESYIRLGLLCPVCSSPVFYVGSQNRKPHTRKSKESIVQVKASTVEAFFSHFEADKNSLLCEARTNPSRANPTKKQVTEGEKNFQKQSLKIFQAHFLSMLTTSHLMAGYEQDVVFYVTSLVRESGQPVEVMTRVLNGIEAKFMRFFRDNLDVVRDLIIKGYKEAKTSLLIDDELDLKIAMEGLQFLSTSSAKKILLLLFRKACSEEIQQIAYAYDSEKKSNPNFDYEDIKCRVEIDLENQHHKRINCVL